VKIPIQNIYYLLCYAWDALDEAELIDVHMEPSAPTVDLFAVVLLRGVEHLLKRGMAREYRAFDDDLAGVRGRIRFSETVSRQLFANARTWCEFDELGFDIPPNRIIKASLRQLLRVQDLDKELRSEAAGVYRRLSDVGDTPLEARAFRTVQIRHSTRFYGFLMDVCRLLHENLMVDETTGAARFRDFVRDERQMALLFQKFVRNLLHREQKRYSVSSPQLQWCEVEATSEALAYLPTMQTDIVLSSSQRQIIIDTKFYKEAFQGRFGQPRIRSEHLYQLDSYMTNAKAQVERVVEGILLYPSVGQDFALGYRIRGRSVQVRSLNLAQPWRDIRQQLLNITAA
jgi:5-methylcytosine-specific restriction enzyme subunit McrC